jgi:ankyrin repeat protein
MSSALPDRPDLDFEKKQAKALLKAFKAGDADAVSRMRAHLDRLKSAGSAATLADAQFVIARERGFESWTKLKAYIETVRPLEEQILPFIHAACSGRLAIAQRILAAHPALTTHSFHCACAAADINVVSDWLARDPAIVSAFARPHGRALPIVVACASHMYRLGPQVAAASVQCVRLLIEHGADPNTIFTQDGAELPVLFSACMANNVGVVRLLLERGAKANDNESAHHSAEMNRRECLELLLAHGAELGPALYFVAQSGGRIEGAQWLLEHGADPDFRTPDRLNETPLHRAAVNGNIAMTELLVRHGADVNAVRADGRSSYGLAARCGNPEVSERLAAAGASKDLSDVDVFLAACIRGDEDTARSALARSPDLIRSLTDEDRELFHRAAEKERIDAVRLMASLGFEIGRLAGEDGATALHVAAWNGRAEMARTLITLGAPLNLRDNRFGCSPLAWAAHGSQFARKTGDDVYCAIVDMLIDAGSTQPETINKWNELPFGSPAVRALMNRRGFPTGQT